MLFSQLDITFCEVPIQIVHHSTGLFILCHIDRHSLYICDMSPVLDILIANIFFHSVGTQSFLY